MSKLNKYNQKVIAVLGTLTIIFFTLVLILLGYDYVEQKLEDFSREKNHHGGLTLDTLRNQNEEVLRDQEISLMSPRILDSTKNIFILPISTIDLEKPEAIKRRDNFFANSSKLNVESPHYPNHKVNNLVIYDYETGQKEFVFDHKTSIERFRSEKINNNHYLLIFATQQDTNHDKKLNDSDLQSFFIYDVSKSKLHSFETNHEDARHYSMLHDTNSLIVYFAKDKNKNGKTERKTEAENGKLINLQTLKIKDFLTQAELRHLQSLVD